MRHRPRSWQLILCLGACVSPGPPGSDDDTTGGSSSEASTTPQGQSQTSAMPPGGPASTEPASDATATPTDETTAETSSDPATSAPEPSTGTSETSETGGEATTILSTGVGSTTDADPGLYGPCVPEEPRCPFDQQCFMVMGVDGEFCSPMCEAMACPDNQLSSAAPACALVEEGGREPVHCVLICDPLLAREQCPAGMSCKQVPDIPVGICTAP
jgi:hypothetical protein